MDFNSHLHTVDQDRHGTSEIKEDLLEFSPENDIPVESIQLTKNLLDLKIGEQAVLGINLSPYNATQNSLIWESSPKTFLRDTTQNITVFSTYQFRITSLNATQPFSLSPFTVYQFKLTSPEKPKFVAGLPSFEVWYVKNIGNEWYYKVKAIGKPRDGCGFYINVHQLRLSFYPFHNLNIKHIFYNFSLLPVYTYRGDYNG